MKELKLNLILENSKFVQYYTYLVELFTNIPTLTKYTYFISDLDCNYGKKFGIAEDNFFITGTELYQIVLDIKIQFIWAVLSAFSKIHNPYSSIIPYAEDNSQLWTGIPKPQAENAEFEIICWDSSATLFIGISNHIGERLKQLYPDIKDLNKMNQENNKPKE